MQSDALLLCFAFSAQPCFPPLLDGRQNVGFVAGMFQSHVLEQDFELHGPYWFQGLSDFADEGIVIHPAFFYVLPTAFRQTTACFDRGAKIRGDQRLQRNCCREIRLSLIFLKQCIYATKCGVLKSTLRGFSDVPIWKGQAWEHHRVKCPGVRIYLRHGFIGSDFVPSSYRPFL
jgi:hypothetical protein